MKVLMFGWEFPPHISGGLGTACYGLTKGLAQQGVEVLFVMPKAVGDEDSSIGKIINASDVEMPSTTSYTDDFWQNVSFLPVSSGLIPYLGLEEYEQYVSETESGGGQRSFTHLGGKFPFSGKYGTNLMEEVRNYAYVASKIARENDFDVIHAHDWLTYPAGIHAKQISGKPMVIHVHATDYDRSRGNVNPEVYAIEKNGMDFADHIITVSNLTRNTVIEKYHQDPSKVTTVHNAVEPLSQDIVSIQDKRGVKDKVVTFLGRITMQKGPEYFVEAAAKVLEKADNVRFVMAGSGDMMDQMIRLAASRNISDRFHFTGFMKGKQVYEVLKSSDVYVMPSVSEPFGISPLEAMQCGVPSIISKQSGCAEILDYAVKVDYWDIEAMADAIYGIITYPAMYQFLKEEGKREVDNIKWEYAGQKVRRIYDQVMNK